MAPISTSPGFLASMDMLRKTQTTSIHSITLQWPEMSAMLTQVNKLNQAGAAALSMAEEHCLKLIVIWAQRLADGPIPPKSSDSGYTLLATALADAIAVRSAYCQQFEYLEQCVTAITDGPHPAAAFLEDWISAQEIIESPADGPRPGEPAIALVSKNNAAQAAVDTWLQEEGLYATAITYSKLKRSPAFETVVLFGPPSRYESSKWCHTPESDFRAQWLLTSSPAENVLIISWPFHSKIDLALVGPWQGYTPPVILPLNDSQSTTPLPTFEFSEAPVIHRTQFDFVDDSEIIAARQYEILGDLEGLWVFFDDAIGPRPRLLSADFSQTWTPSAHQILSIGTHLIFRSHDVEREHLIKASEAWWETKYPEFSFQLAEHSRIELKQNIQRFLDNHGLEELKRRFISSGLSKEYSLQLHSRIMATEYVAPQTQENYGAVCRAIEYRPTAGAFALLSKLRTARQQAGLAMMRELIQNVQAAATGGLLDDLGDAGHVKIHDETLGDLFISTVVHISPERTAAPLSKLGRPLDRGGAIWLK